MSDVAAKWNNLPLEAQDAAIAQFSIGYSIDAMKKLMREQGWGLKDAKDVVEYAMTVNRNGQGQSK